MKKISYGFTVFGCFLAITFSCSKEDTSPECTSPPAITLIATSTNCGTSGGALQVETSGGSEPMQYSIDGSTFVSTNTFTNLATGDYTVTVKDANGCTATATQKVAVDAASISYEATIKDIIATNCAIAGCHVAGTGRPDFTQLSNIQANAAQVKIRTGNKSMPLVGSLTDEEIKLIACWVDAGAPDN